MTDENNGGSGLRGKIIDIICEAWPNSDNELRVTTLSYRLLNKGVEASEQDVAYVLAQLANRGDIELGMAPAQLPSTDLTITDVSQDLCKQPQKPHSPGPSREPPGGWGDSAL